MGPYIFLHSPLVGPFTWGPTGQRLSGLIPDLRGFVHDPPPFSSAYVRRATAAAADTVHPVLVAHSGAGAFLPLIASQVRSRPAALVFVDAILPPSAGHFVVSPSHREFLATHVEGERLRPWSTWWDEATLRRILPAAADRAALAAGEPRVPVALYDEAISMPRRWEATPCAFLRLSAAYDAELTEAVERGWLTHSLDSTHLAPVTNPEVVATHIESLVESLLGPERSAHTRRPPAE